MQCSTSVPAVKTPSHGNPSSTNALNTELNNVARNTNDTTKARALVAKGADLSSTNGEPWRHTPLHQAAFHGRHEMAKTLVELGAPLSLHSNPCGRGATGIPLELARGGGHHEIAKMLEDAMGGGGGKPIGGKAATGGKVAGTWAQYSNIDMCGQGDVEIIGDWKRKHSIEDLKRMVEERGYSAFTVSAGQPSFGHAALKKFPFALTKAHCKPISTCCRHPCTIHVFTPAGAQCEEVDEGQSAPAFSLAGWSSYNERLNGEYVPEHGQTVNGRPVFSHMHHVGVGAGHNWCRMWYAHGAWRIGHVSWVYGDNAIAVAYCKSNAMHPAEISEGGVWMQHKGTDAGRDFGKDESQFKKGGSVVVSDMAPSSEPEEASAAAGVAGAADMRFFVLRDADFKGRNDRSSSVPCTSLDQAAALVSHKGGSRRADTCYAWRGSSQLVTIPAVGAHEMGNGAKWSSGGTLIVCGHDTGHRSKGKILIALPNVDCCFGDGKVFGGVHSYEDALSRVQRADNVQMTAYFWHSSSSRLIEKPKNKESNWVGYEGYGWLFLWADDQLGSDEASGQADVPVVMGAPVIGQELGVASQPKVAVAVVINGAPPSLNEVAELIRRELRIEGGNIKDVLEQGCKQLGVDTTGKPLLEIGRECWTLLAPVSA